MTDRSKTLEAMARAICDADPLAPESDAPIYIGVKSAKAWEARVPMADAALTAYESHLQAEGMAVVPVALVERVIRVWEWNHDEYGDACREYDSAAVAIRDYLAASPYGKAVVQEASAEGEARSEHTQEKDA